MTTAQPLYLIRHAQSQANADHTILYKKTNVGISLTEVGVAQAQETAKKLYEQAVALDFKKNVIFKIWNSPYERTRETADIIKAYFQERGQQFLEEETIYISERQFGLVDDAPDHRTTHSAEYSHYMLHKEDKRDFWARPPLGESPFDVCLRVDFFLKHIVAAQKTLPDSPNTQIVHVLVSHGAAIRSLVMMHLGLAYEEYAKLFNPANASITRLNFEAPLEFQWFKPSVATI